MFALIMAPALLPIFVCATMDGLKLIVQSRSALESCPTKLQFALVTVFASIWINVSATMNGWVTTVRSLSALV